MELAVARDTTCRPTQFEWARIIMLFEAPVDLPGDVRDAQPIGDEAEPFVIDHVRALLAADGRTGVLDTLVPRVDPPRPLNTRRLRGHRDRRVTSRSTAVSHQQTRPPTNV